MPRESIQAKQERTRRIIDRLGRTYPRAKCELSYRTPFELLIATILSAQATDKQVNLVTPGLFRRFPAAEDYAEAEESEIASHIRRLGLFRNKARSIKRACGRLIERFGGQLPKTIAELIELEGVGRKTANVVLGNAFQISEGVVVDTHVARLSQRLGLTRETAPAKIERDLQRLVPKRAWILFSHWLIWHGRRRCFARRPDCPSCELAVNCPGKDKFTRAASEKKDRPKSSPKVASPLKNKRHPMRGASSKTKRNRQLRISAFRPQVMPR